MRMPPDLRVKGVVIHYLDSINSPKKVELINIIKVGPSDIDSYYENDKKQSIQLKTDSQKKIYGLDTVEMSQEHSFFCVYRINGIKHTSAIQLDTALSRVIHVTEMNN